MINFDLTPPEDRDYEAIRRSADQRHALIMSQYEGLKFEPNDRPADRSNNHSRGSRKHPRKFIR